MMSSNLREWLIKIGGGTNDGAQTKAQRITGLRQPHISKIMTGASGGNVKINTLEGAAEHMGVETWRLIWAIETGSLLEPKDPSSPDNE